MRIISMLSALALVAILAFGTAFYVADKGWTPWVKFQEVHAMVKAYRRTGNPFFPALTARALPSYPDAQYTMYEPELASEGLLLLNRFNKDTLGYTTEILDADGTVLHQWPVDYSRIAPGKSPQEFVHVALPMPDGSLLVNFDDAQGMARLDACGDPMWTNMDQVYHHSIRPDTDAGGYWTWESNLWDGGHDQRMVRFDENTGEILESIDLMSDVMPRNPAVNELIFGLPEGFEIDRNILPDTEEDILHPNDVTPLPSEFADNFPLFDTGDLLISLRFPNMVMVIDRETHDILWWQQGPWSRQHDPDYESDGTITVYSNYTYKFRSAIIRVDPVTGEFRDEFRGTGFRFDSAIMGQHDRLPNGNWLVTSPAEGRVIELTADGQEIREYVNYVNDDWIAMVTYAQMLPEGFFDAMPSCDAAN